MPDPKTLPLVQSQDMVRVGKFHVPFDQFEYGGDGIAFNPTAGTLFLAKSGVIGEINIPPIQDPPVRAGFLQPMNGLVWSHMGEAGPQPADRMGGIHVANGKLLGNVYVYFDANNSQERSHFACGLNMDPASFKGLSQVSEPHRSGFVAGAMCDVPAEWRDLLGGDMLTGQGCLSIIYRTSSGPAAYAVKAADIGNPVVPAIGLVVYPQGHATLGNWNDPGPSELFSMGSQIGGMCIPPGTRSLLFFGGHGMGPNCYGSGTSDPDLVGTIPPGGGEPYCYDPMNHNKAAHSYPYRYQVWAYDLNDLADVKAGLKQPWEPVPYDVWELDLGSVQAPTTCFATFDASTNRVYLSQYKGEPTQFGGGAPAIHAIDIKIGTPEPPVDPDPPDPVDPDPPIDPCASYKQQVVSLTMALEAEAQRHAVTASELSASKSKLSTVNAEANGILVHNAQLKPNARLPKWCSDAVTRIKNLSTL